MFLCLRFEVESLKYYDVLGWIIVGSLGSAMGIELLYMIAMQFYKIGIRFRIIINSFKALRNWLQSQFKQKKRKKTARTLNKRLPRLTYVASELDILFQIVSFIFNAWDLVLWDFESNSYDETFQIVRLTYKNKSDSFIAILISWYQIFFSLIQAFCFCYPYCIYSGS